MNKDEKKCFSSSPLLLTKSINLRPKRLQNLFRTSIQSQCDEPPHGEGQGLNDNYLSLPSLSSPCFADERAR